MFSVGGMMQASTYIECTHAQNGPYTMLCPKMINNIEIQRDFVG